VSELTTSFLSLASLITKSSDQVTAISSKSLPTYKSKIFTRHCFSYRGQAASNYMKDDSDGGEQVIILKCGYFKILRGLGIFLFATASRTALRPTQPPIQWVPGALSMGVKRPGLETGHPLPSASRSITSNPPIRLSGLMLS
jgi:hypothetical protein